MEGVVLSRSQKMSMFLLLALIVISCEDATVDHAADLVGVYTVETALVNSITTYYSDKPMEEAWIIDISRESLVFYVNTSNHCDTSYEASLKDISKITDTTIRFEDGNLWEYELTGENVLLMHDADILTLKAYADSFPPVPWTDPSQLENDDYEPDNSLATATRISAASAEQTHFSAECDDADYYIFEALAGTSYIISAKKGVGTSVDLTISLYNLSGDSVAYNDDKTSTNVDPELDWTCPVTGDYYFVVKKYWDYLDPGNSLDDEKGSYTVQIEVTKGLAPGGSDLQAVKSRNYRAAYSPVRIFLQSE